MFHPYWPFLCYVLKCSFCNTVIQGTIWQIWYHMHVDDYFWSGMCLLTMILLTWCLNTVVINDWIMHLGVTQCHIYIRCKLIMFNVCFHCFLLLIDIPVPLCNLLYTLISTPPLPPCFLLNFWNCPDCLFCNSTYIKCASQYIRFYPCYELELSLFVLAH